MSSVAAVPTIQNVKDYLGITKTAQDNVLQLMLDSVVASMEQDLAMVFEVNPALVPGTPPTDTAAPVTLTFTVANGTVFAPGHVPFSQPGTGRFLPQSLVLTIPHARTVTAVTLNAGETVLTPSVGVSPGYLLQADFRIYGLTPFYRRLAVISPSVGSVYSVEVTGRFGITPLPADIFDAMIVMTARRYKERDARFGDTVQLPDGGILSYFNQLPASVKATMNRYMEFGA